MRTTAGPQFWPRRLLLALILCASGAQAGLAPSREDIVILVDTSQRMRQVDSQTALPAALHRFLSHTARDVRAALVLFDGTVSLAVPFTEINEDLPEAMGQALEGIDYNERFSNSAAALERALYELKNNARPGAGRSILLVTSGGIDTGNEAQDLNFTRWLANILAEDAAEARIRVFPVAFTQTADLPVFESLARETGGAFYRYSGDSRLSPLFEHLNVDLFARPAARQ